MLLNRNEILKVLIKIEEDRAAYQEIHVVIRIEGGGVDVVEGDLLRSRRRRIGRGRYWRIGRVETWEQISHSLRLVVHWEIVDSHFRRFDLFGFLCSELRLFSVLDYWRWSWNGGDFGRDTVLWNDVVECLVGSTSLTTCRWTISLIFFFFIFRFSFFFLYNYYYHCHYH